MIELTHVPPQGFPAPSRPNLLAESLRLRHSYSKAELKKLCELLGGAKEVKPIVRIVEKYIRGVPTKTEE